MPSLITPCLWFDGQAEEAAIFYTSIFKNGKITSKQHYSEAGKSTHGQEAGTVMTIEFELNGQPFMTLNGGPHFKFNEAISFRIDCEDQMDHLWEKLSEGGDPKKQQCGWVGDKFGVSWQIVPKCLRKMLEDPDEAKSKRTFEAMLGMKKIDIAALEAASRG